MREAHQNKKTTTITVAAAAAKYESKMDANEYWKAIPKMDRITKIKFFRFFSLFDLNIT